MWYSWIVSAAHVVVGKILCGAAIRAFTTQRGHVARICCGGLDGVGDHNPKGERAPALSPLNFSLESIGASLFVGIRGILDPCGRFAFVLASFAFPSATATITAAMAGASDGVLF